MLKRKRFCACVLVPLYAVTWVGGWISHADELRTRAERGYRLYQQENEEMEGQSRKDGLPFHRIELWEGGPKTGVLWCVPVVPGLLLTYSHSTVGPLGGSGGVKLVLYYGFGSKELCMLYGWLA